MKHANFLTGLVVGALVFGGTSAYAAGILAEYSTNHILWTGRRSGSKPTPSMTTTT